MARSHAIWVVTSELTYVGGPPVAAFTVKHELASWLASLEPPQRIWLHVWKMPNLLFNVGGNAHLLRDVEQPEEVTDEFMGG